MSPADDRIANDGWRQALALRARGFVGRAGSVVLLAMLVVGVMQTPQSLAAVSVWIAAAIALEFLESRGQRYLLRRRLYLKATDKVAAVVLTSLNGISLAVLFSYCFISFQAGSRALAIVLFFAIAVYYLRSFRGVVALYAALVAPSCAIIGAAAIASIWTIQANVLAATVLALSVLVTFAQLLRGVSAIHLNVQSAVRSKRRAQETANLAAEATRAKNEFLAVVSHELRTPMNAMLGSAELLRRTGLEGEQAEHLESLLDGGTMLMALLNDLLDAAKIEAGAMRIETIPVDIRRLVDNMQQMWLARASDHGLTLIVEIDEKVPEWIRTDPTRLRQVLFNLLSNAIKFTKAGTVELTVSSFFGPEGTRQLIVSVRDTGIGIPDDVAARLFRPFEQADTSVARHYGGTGLGLSICKGIANALDGSIKLRSKPGVGSTFTLAIPLIEAAAPAGEPAESQDYNYSAQVRVLIAEDHAANRRLIAALLAPLGFEVVMAHDGREAVACFERESFDVVLMDMQMPEMDGLEATRQIRQAGERGAEIPIVALTANTTDEDRRKCAEAGMNGFITKPLDPRELHAAIVRAVALGAGLPVGELLTANAA